MSQQSQTWIHKVSSIRHHPLAGLGLTDNPRDELFVWLAVDTHFADYENGLVAYRCWECHGSEIRSAIVSMLRLSYGDAYFDWDGLAFVCVNLYLGNPWSSWEDIEVMSHLALL